MTENAVDPTSHDYLPCHRDLHPGVCHAVTPDGEYETLCGRPQSEHADAE